MNLQSEAQHPLSTRSLQTETLAALPLDPLSPSAIINVIWRLALKL